MSQTVLRIESLAARALDAAAAFHLHWAKQACEAIAGGGASLVIVMPPAPQDHTDWRRAAARDLAREAAPARVNILASDEEPAIAAALSFLQHAPGVTGQYLPLDGRSAGNPVT